MKIRNGFVTNSSSSSFIIKLKEEQTIEELIKHINKFLIAEGYDKYEEYFKEPVVITQERIDRENAELLSWFESEEDYYEYGPKFVDTDKGSILIDEAYDNAISWDVYEHILNFNDSARRYYNG